MNDDHNEYHDRNIARTSGQRLAGVTVTGEFIGMMIRNGRRSLEITSPVPDSAIFYSSYYDYGFRAFVVIFQDESFPIVQKGSVIPVLPDRTWITDLDWEEPIIDL